MAEKVWIANKHWNKLSHRPLSTFERKSPILFALSHSIHASRAEAVEALIGYRQAAVNKAKKELAAAERALVKALTMKDTQP